MQPLTITQIDYSPFKVPLIEPLSVAGHTMTERNGFYLTLQSSDGHSAQGEIAPLEGLSPETPRRVKHEIEEIRSYLMQFKIPCQKEELLKVLKNESHFLNLSASVRFGVESALLLLAAQAAGMSLTEFLGGQLKKVESAILLQGNHQKVMADFKQYASQGSKVFKLKVGDRNIPLDVKKIQDMRAFLPDDASIRLDANRKWSLKEACIFGQLAGNQKIDFIEEPVNDITQLDAFYQETRMRIGLDETLAIVKCGVTAPGRCSPPVASQEGVVAYVLKPMLLGLIPTLDWIEEARISKRKAIISSCYESPVGFKVLMQLAALTDQVAGLDTQRWFNP